MTLAIILGFIVIHWIADFWLQTQEMATGKGKSIKWLTLHALEYSVVLFLCGFWYSTGNPFLAVWFTLINGSCHWLTDFCTSRIMKKLWAAKKERAFFMMLGIDQLIHYITLFITYKIIYG